ncbi:hypothetical protein DRN73_09500 [Candidatus Pacearchaeota archaeon]|nr:MAG: hypothetical protein DRN73_09500 [Candidatus Pacearchaeota archaeon]
MDIELKFNLNRDEIIQLTLLIEAMTRLKYFYPQTAWKMLIPIIEKGRQSLKEKKTEIKEEDKVFVLKNVFDEEVRIAPKNWFAEYMFSDKPISLDIIPEALFEDYYSKNANIILAIIVDFFTRLEKFYGFEETLRIFLEFLKNVKNLADDVINKKNFKNICLKFEKIFKDSFKEEDEEKKI